MDNKVLLIYPPYFRLLGEARIWYPLGLGYLASSLNRFGIRAYVYNCDAEFISSEEVISYREKFYNSKAILNAVADDKHRVWNELKHIIESTKPDMIGVSVITESLPTVHKICEICKSIDKNLPIVLGGPHSQVDSQSLLAFKDWDYVLLGEAETRFVELVKCVLSGRKQELTKIGGLIFRHGADITASRLPYEATANLDVLPYPNIDDMIGVNFETKKKIKKTMIATSRGCPFKCSFCVKSMDMNKVRLRSSESVIAELNYNMSEHAISRFYFNDDTFGFSKRFLHSFCKWLIEHKVRVSWSCMTHAKLVNRENLELMRNAGCESIHIGVESGSPKIFKLLNKGVSIDQTIEACELIKDEGIKLQAFFMIGLPRESEDDIRSSMSLLEKLQPYEAILQVYVPYPGTRLFRSIVQKIGDVSGFYNWYEFYKAKLNYRLFSATPAEFDLLLNEFFDKVEAINTRNRVYG